MSTYNFQGSTWHPQRFRKINAIIKNQWKNWSHLKILTLMDFVTMNITNKLINFYKSIFSSSVLIYSTLEHRSTRQPPLEPGSRDLTRRWNESIDIDCQFAKWSSYWKGNIMHPIVNSQNNPLTKIGNITLELYSSYKNGKYNAPNYTKLFTRLIFETLSIDIWNSTNYELNSVIY